MPIKPKITASVKGDTACLSIIGSLWDWKADFYRYEVEQLVAKGVKNCDLYMNTDGGDAFAGNDIANTNKLFEGTVNCKLGVLCASAGTYVASKVNGKVSMPGNGNYMIHKPMANLRGNHEEIMAGAKLLKNISEDYAKTYSVRTGKTVDEIKSLWVEDYWMNAEEAHAMGFIDEIVEDETLTGEAKEMLQAYAAVPQIAAMATPPPKNTNPNLSDMDIKVIAAAFGLAATATEAEIMAHAQNLKNEKEALAAERETLKTEKAALEAKLKEQQTAGIKAMLDEAVASNKIKETDRPLYEALAEKDLDNTRKVLAAITPHKTITSQLNKGVEAAADEKYKDWPLEKFQKEAPSVLAAMRENEPEKYSALLDDYKARNKR